MAAWSSLPADLINRIADRLLSTDDIDYYMDFRAVCNRWRCSTADPKNDANTRRFLPRQWAMLDEVHQADSRLFVNLGTGRFVRRDLPLLRRYYLIAGAAGGSLVLAEKEAPHAARVLNPFTGAMVSFQAPVPSEGRQVAARVIGGSSSSTPTTLVLLCDKTRTIYWADDPGSEGFMAHKEEHFAHPLVRVALEGGIYAAAREGGPLSAFLVPEANRILGLIAKPFAGYFAGGDEGDAGNMNNRCFLVESAGEMLIVFKLPQRVEVYKIDTGASLLERVKNLGRRALFVGDCRCLSVDADRFASVEANCVYYVVEEPWYEVCVYSLEDDKEVRAGPAIDSLNPFTLSTDPPFSEVQLLCCHTFEVRYSQLGWKQMFSGLEHVNVHAPEFDDLVGYDSESADDFFEDLQQHLM